MVFKEPPYCSPLVATWFVYDHTPSKGFKYVLKRIKHSLAFFSFQMEEVYKNKIEHSRNQKRLLAVAFTAKLEEKETFIEGLREEHDKTLAFIARELALLQASMLKEQRRLETLVHEKTRAAEALSLENERLKKHNKKLQSNVKMLSPDNDMDTPSSEDCSPKSSFSSKGSSPATTKVQVEVKRSTTTPKKLCENPTTSVTSTKILPQKRPPPPPPIISPNNHSNPGGLVTKPKPPVPSRAGVDKKLCETPRRPPMPPLRSTSLAGSPIDVPELQFGKSHNLGGNPLQRVDSGRESDMTSDVEAVNNTRILLNHQDEGFCSSHEDPPTGRILVNHHRGVQKPSDLKFRAKVKATSLAVLEETEAGGGQKTTVTYWTEPYL